MIRVLEGLVFIKISRNIREAVSPSTLLSYDMRMSNTTLPLRAPVTAIPGNVLCIEGQEKC